MNRRRALADLNRSKITSTTKFKVLSTKINTDDQLQRAKENIDIIENMDTRDGDFQTQNENILPMDCENIEVPAALSSSKTFSDIGIQVDFLPDLEKIKFPSNTFVCNRSFINKISEAETQTEIFDGPHNLVFHKQRKYRDSGCNTDVIKVQDKSVATDVPAKKGFNGYESIKNDEQLIDLAGVDADDFKILLRRSPESESRLLDIENRLLIFLMILKNGLTSSAVGVLFGVHRTTISRVFYTYLQHLSCTLSNFVFWPNKDVIQRMPECFKKFYGDTRVIIDCTEFQIEIPAGVDNRVFTYSHYKKGFTAKALIGIAPCGFVSFKSYVAGGRKADTQITVESGLLDLLENGDTVLADKGFPEVQVKLQKEGKKVLVVLPPFLKDKGEFSFDETSATYNIASVRIHVERIMQRIKMFHILSKVPVHLFPCLDDIITVCCALVNLQSAIIAYEEK